MNRSLYAIVLAFAFAVSAIPTHSAAAETTLLGALKSGDLKAFKRELKSPRADLNYTDDRGFTALMYATRYLSTREMKRLLDRGADPNFRSKDKFTAFNFAVHDLAKARLLIDRGFDFNTLETNSLSPLMIAARHPRGFDVVKLLVSNGADVNAKGLSGATALFRSVFSGDVRIVKLLVENGADLHAKFKYDDGSDGFPLNDSIYVGNDDVIRFLLAQGPDLNASDNFGGHSLSAALLNGNEAIAREAINRGADIRAAKGIGQVPPIVFAAHNERGSLEMLKLLVEKGADINSHNDNDETALTWARKRGETPLVRFLEQNGAKDPASPRSRLPIPSNDVHLTTEKYKALVRPSVIKSISILQKGSEGFLNREGRPESCVSCHHQTLPGIAFGWGAHRGIPIDQALVKRQIDAQTNAWRKVMAKAWSYDDPLGGTVENISFGLLNLSANSYPSDDLTDVMSFYLAEVQQLDGGWISFLGRPPAESTRITSTALALRALQLYPPTESRNQTERRTSRARTFLLKQKTFTTEERTFQLLGLLWAGARQSELSPLAHALLKTQRPDGGWSQIPSLESDAYATGESLLALVLSRQLSIGDPAWLRGAEFLLRTQFPDGSWLVKTRSWPFQTHFSTGFPHGRDQWISASATAWSALALMTGLDSQGPPALQPRQLAAQIDQSGR